MVNAVKPPPGWLALPATASDEEKGNWNEFLEQWQLQESKFEDDEEWSKISRKLRKEPSCKLYNHFIGKKVQHKDLTWGHLVAALILFGKDQVINSTFGKRIQEKYPKSDITTMQFNTRGPTIRISSQSNGRGQSRSRRAIIEYEDEGNEDTEEQQEREREQQVSEEGQQVQQQEGQQVQQVQQQEGEGVENHRVPEEVEVPSPAPAPAPVLWNTRRCFTNTTSSGPKRSNWRSGNIFGAAPPPGVPTNNHSQPPHPQHGTTRSRDSASGPVQSRESPPQPDSTVNVISNSDPDTTTNVAQENSDSDLRQAHDHMTISSSPGPGEGCHGIYLPEDTVAATNTTASNGLPSNNFTSIDLTSAGLTDSSVTDQSRNSRLSSNTSASRLSGVFPPSPWSTATSRPTPRKRNIDQVGDDIAPRPSPVSPAVWASLLSKPSSPHVNTFAEPINATYGHLANHTGTLEQILQRYHQLGGYVISLEGPENEHTQLRENGISIIRDIETWGLQVTESRNRALTEIENLRESNHDFARSNQELELANSETAKAEANKALDTLVSQFADHLSDSRAKFETFRQHVWKSLEENEAKTGRSLHEKLESLEAQMSTTTATLKEDRAREVEMMQSKLERLEAMLEKSTENNEKLERQIEGLIGVVADVGAASGVVNSHQQWNTALEMYGLM
ncbi:hypothetical protein ACHAPO_007163 [Fusarium lateritium]